ncbi:hypothetical protein BAE44_0023893, partial [Dichanthelium oligosanthes]
LEEGPDGGGGYEPALCVTEAELSFLRNSVYSKHVVVFAGGFPYVRLLLLMDAAILFLFYAIHDIPSHDKAETKDKQVIWIRHGVLVTHCIIAIIICRELMEVGVFVLSQWTKVWIICHYIRLKRRQRQGQGRGCDAAAARGGDGGEVHVRRRLEGPMGPVDPLVQPADVGANQAAEAPRRQEDQAAERGSFFTSKVADPWHGCIDQYEFVQSCTYKPTFWNLAHTVTLGVIPEKSDGKIPGDAIKIPECEKAAVLQELRRLDLTGHHLQRDSFNRFPRTVLLYRKQSLRRPYNMLVRNSKIVTQHSVDAMLVRRWKSGWD